MRFAEKLRQLRDDAGLTQEQLAEQSGINLWTIRGYEQKRREPNWKGFLSLAKALGVVAEVFADCDGSATVEDPAKPRGRPRKMNAGQGEPAPAKKTTRKQKG